MADLFDGITMSQSASPAGEKPAARPKPPGARKAAQRPRVPKAPDHALAPADPLRTALELAEALPDLDVADQQFARSLLGQFYLDDTLSARQWEWAGRLTAKAREGRPSNVVVLSLTRHGGLIAALAAQLADLRGAERRAFIRTEIDRHVENLIVAGVPRHLARSDARALLTAAEAHAATANDGGCAA